MLLHRSMLRPSALVAVLCAVGAVGTVVAMAASSPDPEPAPFAPQTQPANEMTFDFKDPKGVNAINFMLDSELEPIVGFASGLSGTITYDPSDPTSFRGALEIDAGKVNTSNPRMTSVLQGADWLDLASNAAIRFTFSETLGVERARENEARLWVRGTVSVRGISAEKIVMIDATFIPDGVERRGGAASGDLLVLRSTFSIDRTEFNLKPGSSFDKVAQSIDLSVAIAGYSK